MHTFQFTQPKKFKKGTLQKTYGCFETGYPANYCYKSKELMSKYYKHFHDEDYVEFDDYGDDKEDDGNDDNGEDDNDNKDDDNDDDNEEDDKSYK